MKKIIISASDKTLKDCEDYLIDLKKDFDTEVYDKDKKYTFDQAFFLVIGGDGSLNYFVSNIESTFIPKVIYIPLGTANDFAKSVFPLIPSLLNFDLQRVIKRNTFIEIPIMSLNDRYFINVATCGAPAQVTEEQDDEMKESLGQLSYYLSGIKKLFTDNKLKINLKYDKIEKDIITCGFVVSQGLFAGGGIRVNPSFTSCFGDDFSFISTNNGEMIKSIIAIKDLTMNSALVDYEGLEVLNLEEITISSNVDIPVKLDGEPYKSKSLNFKKSEKVISFFLY